jgi:hypothetical protein
VVRVKKWCAKCGANREVVDDFLEADHGLDDAVQWRVYVLSCDHHIEGTPRSAVAAL